MSIQLGRIGFWRHPSALSPEVVAEVESLGYGAIWLGGSPGGDLKVVEDRFKAADRDNDGTLDERELRSRAGQALLRLLQ